MDILHITQTKNVPSIIKNGIFRSKPLLPQYDEVMKEDYGSNYDCEKGLVFGFPENINQRNRYIKDFFYWKTWGEKRNIFLDDCDYDQFTKCQEIGSDVFSHIKITPVYFSVILINIPYHPLYGWYQHEQSHTMNVFWSNMDTRYEHNDKPLVLINYDIKPDKIKKVIGIGESTLNRNNKINVSLKI
jgi:hypothetical protein